CSNSLIFDTHGLPTTAPPSDPTTSLADASRLERFLKDRRRAQSLPALLHPGPGCQERKKSVKFADSMGLTLAEIKHFSTLEEPQIPTKVLHRHRSFPPQDLTLDPDPDQLVPIFPEPWDAEHRAQRLRVCLERITVTRFDVRGQIRVLDRSPVKEVGVRYTFNEWLSHVDAQALPGVADQPDLLGERFVFTVHTPPCTDPNEAVHFAVYLRGHEGEFWDNNNGQNYTLRYRCSGNAFHPLH
uniref:Protein phosphatase 1 regulatory subunit 3G n=1 Tax=Gouania willdenowi TaxID=441366 RepID=A0A8C5DFS5_GOUWI